MEIMTAKTKKRIFFLFISLLISLHCVSAQPGGEGVVIGKSYTLKSDIFNEERTIMVYLPSNYKTSEEKYPVLYVLDGYDHFHYVSGMVLSLSRNRLIPRMIVVGIHNPNRYRDFTPQPIESIPESGEGDKFLQFAEKELFPFVEKYFRTVPCRVLIGHSLCGMFSMYTMFKYPEMFKGIIAVSPGAWFNDNFIIEYAKQYFENNSDLNNILYMTVGGKEQRKDIESILDFTKLLETYKPSGLDWGIELREGEGHHAVVHMSIYNGLNFIFSDMMLNEDLLNDSIYEIIIHYENISEKYGYKISPPENILNSVGYKYLNNEEISDAIETFKINLELYPKSANAHNSLAEAYELNNRLEDALTYYKKAVEIANKNRDPNLYYFMEDYENIQKKILDRK